MSTVKKERTAISPTRSEDYPEWFQQVVKASDLAENSQVRGCMVIKPWGYAIWENMQAALNRIFKTEGYKNAYFPLFIPKSYLEEEAEHVDGFAKECAVITHTHLEANAEGELNPASPLEDPLIVRPTSETIIGETFAKWVKSHRDLPLKINQWANVVRWEMRTRLFLRTTEFLWQEGHSAFATEKEAQEEAHKMLYVYSDFIENYMAIPAYLGEKSESERFPGASQTLCLEPMMQDRKALQAGTSHFLGQNFAKTANISFSDDEGKKNHAWTVSFGMSTRVIGAMIMVHSDDDGLVIPPRMAPSHIVIQPVLNKKEMRNQVLEYCEKLKANLEAINYCGQPIDVELDTRNLRGGEKMWQWVKKGIPLRIEIGTREIESDSLFVGRRDKSTKERYAQSREEFIGSITKTLDDIQNGLYQRALAFRNKHTIKIDSKKAFYEFFTPKDKNKPEIHGGFAMAHWNGSADVEKQIKQDLKVTIRCIPLEDTDGPGTCIFTGEPSKQRVIWAKAY